MIFFWTIHLTDELSSTAAYISPAPFHLTIHHPSKTTISCRFQSTFLLALFSSLSHSKAQKLTYDCHKQKKLKQNAFDLFARKSACVVRVVNDDFYSIYYKLFHTIIDISPLSVDRNTIFYKVLYKQFQTLEEEKKKEKCLMKGERERERVLWAGKKLTPEPHNIKAINQIFINLLDSVTIKTVQWFSSSFGTQLLKVFPLLHQQQARFVISQKAMRKKRTRILNVIQCFPLLINPFEISEWFASDVKSSCRCFSFFSQTKLSDFLCISKRKREKLWKVESYLGRV